MAKSKKRSHNWSTKEMKQIEIFIDGAVAAGKSKMQGYDDAAAHFGVTRNAISIRYGRYLANIKMSKAKSNTQKTPSVGKIKPKRPYKKRASILDHPITHHVYPVAREITFDIRDVKVDLVNRKITFIY